MRVFFAVSRKNSLFSRKQFTHTKQKILPVFSSISKHSSKLAFNHRDEEGGDEEQQQTRKNNNADVESREGVLLLVANLFVALFNVHVVRFL